MYDGCLATIHSRISWVCLVVSVRFWRRVDSLIRSQLMSTWSSVWIYSVWGVAIPPAVAGGWMVLGGVAGGRAYEWGLSDGPGQMISETVARIQGVKPSRVAAAVQQMAITQHAKAATIQALIRSCIVVGAEVANGLADSASGLVLGKRHIVTAIHCLDKGLQRRLFDKRDSNGWVSFGDATGADEKPTRSMHLRSQSRGSSRHCLPLHSELPVRITPFANFGVCLDG